MTEEEVIKKLESESGLEFGEQFGFIAGRMSPFLEIRGMQSASNIPGYEIWMKKIDETETSVYRRLHMQKPVEDSWDIIIPFLTYKTEEFSKLLEEKGFFTIVAE